MDRDLRTMLIKPDAPAPRTIGVRTWPRAIPQFNVGHLDVLEVPPPPPLSLLVLHARAQRSCASALVACPALACLTWAPQKRLYNHAPPQKSL